MRTLTIRLAALCTIIAIGSVLPVMADDAAESRRGDLDTDVVRVVQLDHLDIPTATTIARGIYQIRNLAELPDSNAIIIRGDGPRVEAIESMLSKLDRPRADWFVEVVLVSDSGESVLRTLDVEHDDLNVQFGGAGRGTISFQLDSHIEGKELMTAYNFTAVVPGNDTQETLPRAESGTVLLASGDRFPLVAPEIPRHRESLSELLGVSDEARELFLRFRKKR